MTTAKKSPSTTAIKSVDVSAGARKSGKPVPPRGSGNTRKVPAAPRKRWPWTLAVIVVVLGGIVGAGLYLHSRQAGPHGGDLRDYLVDTPSGATRSTDLPGHDGKLDVAALQAQSSNPAGVKTVLDHYHFVGGAVTGWTTGTGKIQLMILRYGSAADATSAVTSFVSGEAQTLGTPTAISTVTNGAVFVTPIDVERPYASGFGRNGDTVILIHEYPTRAADLPDAQKDVTLVLTEQNAKLG